MSHHKFQIDLTLIAPFQTKATSSGEYGVDTPCARDHNGNLYIPGTLIKGKVREAWTWLESWGLAAPGVPSKSEIQDWFGQGTADAARPVDTAAHQTFTPSPGRVRFNDFTLTSAEAKSQRLRTRISIHPTKGCAEEGMLQVLESPFLPDTPVAFSGVANFDGPDTEAAKFRQALDAALRATTTLGANRAIGFGRIQKVSVQPVPVAAKKGSPKSSCDWSAIDGDESSVVLQLHTSFPLCLTERGSAANIFHSGTTITGGTLKGALAAQIKRQFGVDPADPRASGPLPTLRKHFSAVRFRQALPATAVGKTTAIIPQSVFTHQTLAGPKVVDTVLNNSAPTGFVPKFHHDWKRPDEAAVHKLFPQLDLKRDLRVRTRISPANRRAEDTALFAYELILPETTSGEKVHWETTIDLPANISNADRRQFWAELGQALGDGLASVGKTKAPFRLVGQPFLAAAAIPGGHNRNSGSTQFAILLRSPALIGNPETIKGETSHQALHSFYADYFREASSNTLTLNHFFAGQSLMGGVYQYHHFQREATNHRYHPWLLTQPGSVFVFTATQDAEPHLQTWLFQGLPLVGPMRQFYGLNGTTETGDDWCVCPYVPSNGFNEIAVNAHQAWSDLCR